MMKEKILHALRGVIDPDLNNNLVDLGMIKDLRIENGRVSFCIELTTPACPMKSRFKEQCEKQIHEQVDPALEVEVLFDSKVAANKRNNAQQLSSVKNLIAVASGKGGVGKSTVSVNLAVSLAAYGAKVALLDADINGPSIPVMFGVEAEKPMIVDKGGKNYMLPVEKHAVKLMSIGMLVAAKQPILWRGPMLSNALQQLLLDTDWGELDYLIIDLPPGSGDIHITLCQQLPLSAALIVTTPQRVALSDTIKTIEMFRSNNIQIPLIGIVENMSYFTPLELPENKYFIFGKDGAKELSLTYNIPLLGQIPLFMGVSEMADKGMPAVLDPDLPFVKLIFDQIAQKAAQQISIITAKQ
jgi:ATP-binding protein involved in chromosome partitioning